MLEDWLEIEALVQQLDLSVCSGWAVKQIDPSVFSQLLSPGSAAWDYTNATVGRRPVALWLPWRNYQSGGKRVMTPVVIASVLPGYCPLPLCSV